MPFFLGMLCLPLTGSVLLLPGCYSGFILMQYFQTEGSWGCGGLEEFLSTFQNLTPPKLMANTLERHFSPSTEEEGGPFFEP